MIPANPTYSFSGERFRAGKGPLVYVWRRGELVLYVGLGRTGLSRPFGSHHRLRRADILPNDVLDIYECESAAAAVALEGALIEALDPELNGAHSAPVEPDGARLVAKLRRELADARRENARLVSALTTIALGHLAPGEDSQHIANHALGDGLGPEGEALADEIMEWAREVERTPSSEGEAKVCVRRRRRQAGSALHGSTAYPWLDYRTRSGTVC